MIVIAPFHPADLGQMRLQPAQQPDLDQASSAVAFAIQVFENGPAFTARVDNVVLGCAGLVENHPGHATAWALLASDKQQHFVAITRSVRAVLEAAHYPRIDTAVRSDFDAGHRWALLLGFEAEGIMRAWGRDGSDWHLYARKGGMA